MKNQIGRNDPCTCNSGKKYKKCCLVADEFRRKNGSPELNEDLALGEKLVKEYEFEQKIQNIANEITSKAQIFDGVDDKTLEAFNDLMDSELKRKEIYEVNYEP